MTPKQTEAVEAAIKLLERQLAAQDEDCGAQSCAECNGVRRPIQRTIDALRAALEGKE